MGVFRVNKNKNYTVMSNVHLRDKALPLKAKGLLSLMLSLPEDWDYSMRGLSNRRYYLICEMELSVNKANETVICECVAQLQVVQLHIEVCQFR